jgi:predicted ATP-dependent Lon-type protease
MTSRNQDLLGKAGAGLLKRLHPHRNPDTITRKELVSFLDVAVEMRSQVTDHLAKILPAEFTEVEYGYRIKEK